jgi:hypothetical protein
MHCVYDDDKRDKEWIQCTECSRAEFAHFVHNLASKIFFFVAANMYSRVRFKKLYISVFLCL